MPNSQKGLVFVGTDWGGTNIRHALFEYQAGQLAKIAQIQALTADVKNPGKHLFKWIERQKLAEKNRRLAAAVLGIAGLVTYETDEAGEEIPGTATATGGNLPGMISAQKECERLGVPVELMNDLLTAAWGIGRVPPQYFRVISDTKALPNPKGHAAVVAAGTGFGLSGLHLNSAGEYDPFPTEGGHTDFAPANREQDALLSYMRGVMERTKQREQVFADDLICGNGFGHILDFLWSPEIDSRSNRYLIDREERVAEEIAKDPSRAASIISRLAQDRINPSYSCREVQRIFFQCYGSMAGQVAQMQDAMSALYVLGGIFHKNLCDETKSHFMQAFVSKGLLSQKVLMRTPVYVDNGSGDIALLGAAYCASKLVDPN